MPYLDNLEQKLIPLIFANLRYIPISLNSSTFCNPNFVRGLHHSSVATPQHFTSSPLRLGDKFFLHLFYFSYTNFLNVIKGF